MADITIEPGEILEVSYPAENVGTNVATQDIRLLKDGVEVAADSQVEIGVNSTRTGILEWESTDSDASTVIPFKLVSANTERGFEVEVLSAIPDSAIAHFDATTLGLSDGSSVSTWSDQIGQLGDLSQSGSNRPTLKTSIKNGNDVVRFDDASNEFMDSPTLSSVKAQPNTVILVAKMNSTSDNQNFIDSNTSNRHFFQDRGGTYREFAGAQVDGGSPDSNWHIFTLIFNGSSSFFRVDGSQITSGDVGPQDFEQLRVGAINGGGAYMDGDFGELLVYNAELSSSEINDEESRLSDKWGITV